MSEYPSKTEQTGFPEPVSSFAGPIAELVGHGMLSPPSRPGLLASLDRFEVLRLLGAGGMGVVLLARDSTSGAQVAIKMVRPELLADHQIMHRFLKEAGHLQRLRHKNVIEVLEVCDREQGPYFVMPFYEKGNLARRIRPGQPLEPEVIVDFAAQVCEGLQFAHRRGIIHRDLKPANILITADAKACLADFGLARTLFNDTVVDVESPQCEGTAPYMSPGLAAGNAEDTRCDIYAFGALLYEMLTGEAPYKGRTTKEIREQILARPPKAITELNPKADRALVSVAQGAMGRELRDRYADIADVLTDLQRIKEGKPPVGPHGIGRSLRDNLQRVRRIPAVVGLTVALAAIGLLAWMLWHNAPKQVARTLPPPPVTATNPVPAAPAQRLTNPIPSAPTKGPTTTVPDPHRFQAPWGIAVDNAANVYVADTEDCTISKITPAGRVTTLAGRAGYRGLTNGLGGNARFIMPRGAAVDNAGNIYLADSFTIRKVAPTGVVTTLAGQRGYPGATDGIGTNAQFDLPSGVTADSVGNVYVADRHTIRKITPGGEVSTLAGLAGRAGTLDGAGTDARFSDMEKGIAVDSAGNVYVADAWNHTIRRMTPAGEVLTLAGSFHKGSNDGAGTNAGFFKPCGIAVYAAGVVYVADTFNHTIRKITPEGLVSTLAGTAGTAGSADGAGSNALFDHPRGIALDDAGNVYVADTGNRSLRKLTPAGVVTTLAGKSLIRPH